MIEVSNLTKAYTGNVVVRGLTFKIEPGRIYGFLGPNGAGKSTTMNMITGCLAPTEGTVLIDGVDILQNPTEAKKKIGYLPEIPPVYPEFTPREYLTFAARSKGVRRADVADQVERVMAETDITDMQDRLIKNLSKGYRQRVGIAQAMLGNPELIILDEPTVGLDPKQISEIRSLIRRLGQTRTVLLSSHILAEVSEICDHVMILSNGRLLASDTLENIRRDNTPDNRVLITARAKPDVVGEILRSVPGVKDFTVSENPTETGLSDVSAEVEPGTQVLESIFYVFAKKNCAVSRLMKDEPSLEEIFLRMTEEDGEHGNDSPLPSAEADGPDGDDDDDDENNDDNYRPLFGGRREDDR